MKHVVLIGDSIFDNAGYVAEGDSVIDQLQSQLPEGVKASLLAVDGDIIDDVHDQINDLPTDATHVFLSVGGNDALRIARIMNEKVHTVGEAMEIFTEIKSDFQARYRNLLTQIKEKVTNLYICTVHDTVPNIESRSLTALALFNEVILREAFTIGADLIDLRIICNEVTDYSSVSPIEPSKSGGGKIVRRIVGIMDISEKRNNRLKVYL